MSDYTETHQGLTATVRTEPHKLTIVVEFPSDSTAVQQGVTTEDVLMMIEQCLDTPWWYRDALMIRD